MRFAANQSKSIKKRRRLVCVLLVVLVFLRALTPQGFMPNDLGTGVPFVLCHGDAKSVRLLEAMSETAAATQASDHHHHHHHHNQDEPHTQMPSMGACEFGATTLADGLPLAPLDLVFLVFAGFFWLPLRPHLRLKRPYEFPRPRSPPQLFC